MAYKLGGAYIRMGLYADEKKKHFEMSNVHEHCWSMYDLNLLHLQLN